MKIIIAIAWRNIWRNRTRSLLVSGSIALGLWAGAFVMAFAWGLYQNNIHDVVYRLDLQQGDIFICLDSAISNLDKLRLSDKGLIKTI